MAKNFVITIARGFGSGGRTMGQMLAKELGWAYYDTELLQLASDDSGISESLFAQADERAKIKLLSRSALGALDGQVIPPDQNAFTSNENLFRYQAKIIRKLAETENCVIVGRCANYILKDYSNVIRVYVHAPEKVCVRTVMSMFGLTIEEAEKKVHSIDKQRADYYRFFTGSDWRLADDYDLCFDSSRMSWDKCVRIVKACLDSINGD